MTLTRALYVSSLLAVAVGVAPPAVMPFPARTAALPTSAVVAQMPGNSVGHAVATAAKPGSNAELGSRLRGQAYVVPTQIASTTVADLLLMEAEFINQQVSQASNIPTALAIDYAGMAKALAPLLLAAMAGALVAMTGRRARFQPKFAVAAFGSELNRTGATATHGQREKSEAGRTRMHYTTQTILPSLQWVKTGFKGGDLQNGELRTVCLAGCDICVGKLQNGGLFAVGDKAPPTGLSFGVGGEVEGDCIVEAQYGNRFNVKTGQPEGDWCPNPPFIGALVGTLMGDRQAVQIFEVQQAFFGGDLEVLVDTNAKKAYEADYWKGILDAQGKDDGSYY